MSRKSAACEAAAKRGARRQRWRRPWRKRSSQPSSAPPTCSLVPRARGVSGRLSELQSHGILSVVLSVCVAVWVCPLALSAGVSGLVLDPQGRPIAGAQITLSCGRAVAHTQTDRRGEFRLPSSGRGGQCVVTAAYPQFKSLRKRVRSNGKPLIFRPKLATRRDSADVQARPPSRSGGLNSLAGLDSATLSRVQLGRISNNTADLIAYAMLVAGAPPGPDDIYVGKSAPSG